MSIRRVGAGTALMMVGALFTSAQAVAPITGGAATKRLVEPSALTEKAQVFIWGGRRHCFYDDAWNGPGWYWCNYAWRRGYGWGGGPGWHRWRHQSRSGDRGPRRGEKVERRRDDRPGRRDATRGRDARSESGRSGASRAGRSEGRGASSGRSGSDSGRGLSSGRSGGGSAPSGRSGGGEAGGGGRGGGSGDARGG